MDDAELDAQLERLRAEAEALASKPPPASPFWLSHHPPEEYGRTFRLGGVHVCARCLGTYPVLLLAFALQFALGAPLAWRLDATVAIALLLPALIDWAVGRFRPQAGGNGIRVGTGILLGLALGRTLYVHVQQPLPLGLLLQAALVTAVAVPVIFLSWRRRPRG